MTKMINSQMNDILITSNPVMADCPPMKEDYEMTRQSDTDITALYERLSRDDDQQVTVTRFCIKKPCSKSSLVKIIFGTFAISQTMGTRVRTSIARTGSV